MRFWRDVDGTAKRFGILLRAGGGEVYLGTRLYRWTY